MKPDDSIWTDPRTQRWFTVLLVVFFVGVAVQYTMKVRTQKRDGQTASAILRWAGQIQMLEDGEDVHKTHNYPNPPVMAMILWPISELAMRAPVVAALCWFFLKVLMAFCCFWWAFRLVESPGRPFPVWGKVLTMALSLRPIMGDLTHGNVNIFILFTVLASLMAYRARLDLLCGILLALAIACKVTPALFVGYFLWKGATRVLVGTALGLVLWFLPVPATWLGLVQNWESFAAPVAIGGIPVILLCGVGFMTGRTKLAVATLATGLLAVTIPAASLGWAQNWQAIHSWVEGMILPFLVGGYVTPEHNNQSLPGLIARLLTDAPSFSTYIADQYVPIKYDNVADVGAAGAKWLTRLCMVAFAGVFIWRCRGARSEQTTADAPRTGWPLAAEYAIVLVGMLLFSERTWKHHCVTLLLPFAVLCYALAALSLHGWRRNLLTAVLSLGMLSMTLTSTGLFAESTPKLHEIIEKSPFIAGATPVFAMSQYGDLTDSIAKTAQVYGGFTVAFLLLLVGLFSLPLRSARQDGE